MVVCSNISTDYREETSLVPEGIIKQIMEKNSVKEKNHRPVMESPS